MKPKEFKERNVVIAKDQPEYTPLPAYIDRENGRVVFVWQLTWRERLRLLLTGTLWHQVLTFGRPLQPQALSVTKPTL